MSENKKPPLLPIGTVLNGKWVILEFVARGGMGEVYRAHQVNLKRDVALKIISREWLETFVDDPEELENALRRFRQEVETMVQIRHPNVIQIYDYDKARVKLPEGEVELEYLVLEYIPGRTLRSTMREEGFYPLEEETRLWIEKYFFPVLEGVKAIHRAGIFHRDLKPENILLDGEIPKIADFGLARSIRMESITTSLEIKGTPAYMAPEQFLDFKGTDQRADIYALGKILYEAVAGRIAPGEPPFRQVGLKDPKTPFFKALDRIIRRATEEDPQKRFSSVEEMEKALRDLMTIRRSSPARRLPPRTHIGIFLGLFLLFVALVGVIFYQRSNRESHERPSPEPYASLPANLPAEMTSRDGAVMKLLPGGEVKIPPGLFGDRGLTVHLKPFYMDSYPVTNYQYVNFLNSVLSRIRVEDGVVKEGEDIWLYLGKISKTYEPIVYEGGKFVLKDSMHASCPVVRVTAQGARAYARFYGKRLPTKVEWFYAVTEGRGLENPSQKLPETFYRHFELPLSVMEMAPNSLGIRGLSSHFGEWVLETLVPSPESRVVLISGVKSHKASDISALAPVRRMPWEAFEEVGFRCVMDAVHLPEKEIKKPD